MKQLFVLLPCLLACSAEESATPPLKFREEPSARVPDLQCRIADGELRVSVIFACGGSSFELCGTECASDRTNVKLRITNPPPGAVATMSCEMKEIRVPLEGTSGPIHLRLQNKVRGEEYAVEPEFVLARIVDR